jgi:hypothetical protein
MHTNNRSILREGIKDLRKFLRKRLLGEQWEEGGGRDNGKGRVGKCTWKEEVGEEGWSPFSSTEKWVKLGICSSKVKELLAERALALMT